MKGLFWSAASCIASAAVLCCMASTAHSAELQLTSIGPLAFGPDGLLLVSDPMAAKVHAIETQDTKKKDGKVNVANVRQKLADMLGTSADQVTVEDLAVNPASGNVYLAVTRGSGDSATPLILKANTAGELQEFPLDDVAYTSATIANAPESRESRRGNQRMLTVTDMAFVDGRVFVAGLSNEEFASKLRSIPYPFGQTNSGTSVEIYHGAHGRFETQSPVRTFAPYDIEGQAHLLAAYTCTPLVKIPVADLEPGKKITGTTVAELGNRNRPLDMFVYQRDGQAYVLMANNSRGVMKITTANIGDIAGIDERVEGGGTAGLSYETIDALQGVEQLDRLDDDHAVVLVSEDDGSKHIRTIELP